MASSQTGTLEEFSSPELLAELHRRRQDGELVIERGARRKVIYLRGGVPIYVGSNNADECLGKMLVAERLISQSDCDRSLALMQESGRLQGAVLVQMGCLSSQRLKEALQRQIRAKLVDLLAWSHGRFVLRPPSTFPPVSVALHSSTAAIILEGVKRHYPLQRLRALLDPCLDFYLELRLDQMYFYPDLAFTEQEKKFLVQLHGDSTLRQALRFGPGKLLVYRLIYALKCVGVVKLRSQPVA